MREHSQEKTKTESQSSDHDRNLSNNEQNVTRSRLKIACKKSFSGFSFDVTFDSKEARVIAIMGHSGSGKTTFLRGIAGLESFDQGFVQWENTIWQSDQKSIPTHERHLGFVFQDARLFSHLNVENNIDFGIKRASHPLSKGERNALYSVLGIEHLMSRSVNELSGGEQQRVAIARTLVTRPKLLLMDEPLASLDKSRKQRFIAYLKQYLEGNNSMLLYVTHAIEEILPLADTLTIFANGGIRISGNVNDVLNNEQFGQLLTPETFSLIEGKTAAHPESDHLLRVLCHGFELQVPESNVSSLLGKAIRLQLQAKDISVSLQRAKDSSILNILPGEITSFSDCDENGTRLLNVSVGQENIKVKISDYSFQQLSLQSSRSIYLQIKAVSILH